MRHTLLITLAILSLVACTKTDKPGAEGNEPVLTCTCETIQHFNADGGNGEITYTLENPVEGGQIEIRCDAEWITDLTAGQTITFTVTPNTEIQERSDEITVTYLNQNFSVEIIQEGKAQEPNDYSFTITSPTVMHFDAQGGSGEIHYIVEDNSHNDEYIVTFQCDADWISDMGGLEYTTFTVLPNTSETPRTTTITATYIDISYEITIEQDGAQQEQEYIDFEAQFLQGVYYGKQYGSGYNYYIYLSDVGMIAEDEFKDNSTTFRFDIYSSKDSQQNNVILPEGTYHFDINNTAQPGTFSSMYSICMVKEDGEIKGYYGFESGTVTVTENHIEAIVEFMSGDIYRVTYSGPLNITMP